MPITTDLGINKYLLYNGTVTLMFNPIGHRYTVNGEKKIGVTTALSVISKPALLQWAVNVAIDELKVNLKAGVAYDELQLANTLESARLAHKKKKEEAAGFGTLVHNWIEKYIKGQNPEPLVNKTLNDAVQTFLKWVEQNNVKFIASEKPVYSKKYDYCGTIDFICEIDGKKYIGDLKTSKGIYDEYSMQVAAYRYADEEESGTQYAGSIIVRIPKTEDDDVEIAYINNYQKNCKAFLYALGLKRTLDDFKNLARGGEKHAE